MSHNRILQGRGTEYNPTDMVRLDAAGVLWLNGQPWPGAIEDLRARINAHLARVRRFNAAERRLEVLG